MDREWIEATAAALPEKPDREFKTWLSSQNIDELSQELLLFRRESIQEDPILSPLMSSAELEREYNRPRHWGARCSCTACGEEFVAGYTSIKGFRGIILASGEDGMLYSGWCPEDVPEAVCITEGDIINCPYCMSEVRLTRESALRDGRTYAAMTAELAHMSDGSSVLIYWLVRRNIDQYGYSEWEIRPREAVVIGWDRKLYYFTHTKYNEYGEYPLENWRFKKSKIDPEQIPYYCFGTGIGGRKLLGAYHRRDNLCTEGTSAEKTGLDIYLQKRGRYPVIYLRIWQKHPNIENLIRQGWAAQVSEEIDEQLDQMHIYGQKKQNVELSGIIWDQGKPHKMLGMSKEDFRASKDWHWNNKKLFLWLEWHEKEQDNTTAAMFQGWYETFGLGSVAMLTEKIADKKWDAELREVFGYLGKQIGIEAGQRAQMFADYRDMLENAAQEALTTEQLWPRNLRAAHDRLMTALHFKSDKALQKRFDETAAMYAPLEWTDGELCIVVPKTNDDLINEGTTLCHCVGGYGEHHVSGEPIFFVRHYRRPERSYYTLNEDLRGKKPRRVQLHGYGNEWNIGNNGRKCEKRSIPQKVLDFVDRWEQEILLPWDIERKKAAINSASNSFKKTKGRRNAA